MSTHKKSVHELVEQARLLGASGFDWTAIAREYGPLVVQVLMILIEQLQAAGAGGTEPEPSSIADAHLKGKVAELASAIRDKQTGQESA